jgi:hypothetical protein
VALGIQMKEIIQAIESRIKSPVMGYFTIAFLIFNWQALFFLFADNSGAKDRIDYFIASSSFSSLLIFPLLSSIIYTLIYPWVNYIFLYICQKPTDLKNSLQAKSEHNMLVEKNRLEKLRSELQATAEKNIIEQAKRDEEVEGIQDEELKENVRSSIKAIREENSTANSVKTFQMEDPEKLLAIADIYRQRGRDSNDQEQYEEWDQKAKFLEEKAHRIISGSIDSP